MTNSEQHLQQGKTHDRATPALFGAVAATFALAFTFYTQNAWEDFYITFRHSRNLVDGFGPVFTPGERIHGFTSAINTMLPALFYWLTGGENHMPALWLYRLCSIAGFATAGVIMFKLCRQHFRSVFPFIALFPLSTKAVAYTTNGQEAGFMLLFLAISCSAMFSSANRNWLTLGAAWAGLMYTRPDSFVYVSAFGIALLITRKDRSQALLLLIKAAGVCTLLYLPWFIWAWCYFGSPVPHSAAAKSVAAGAPSYSIWGILFSFLRTLANVFRPIYHGFGGWPTYIEPLSYLAGFLPCLYCFLAGKDHFGRFVSIVYTIGAAYLTYVEIRGTSIAFPWYFPPLEFFGGLSLAAMLGRLFTTQRLRPRIRLLAGSVAALLLMVLLVTVNLGTWNQLRHQQALIETGHRALIGQWLRQHVAPDETVYLEPIGYIGFFSGNTRLLDYPGLASPRVVEARLQGHDMYSAIPVLQPDWLVLRPWEAEAASALPEVVASYTLARDFNVIAAVDRVPVLFGRPYLLYDARFLVFKRTK